MGTSTCPTVTVRKSCACATAHTGSRHSANSKQSHLFMPIPSLSLRAGGASRLIHLSLSELYHTWKILLIIL